MGCDIHPVIEWLEYPAQQGLRSADFWMPLSYEPMTWGRSYTLFARMAGVRIPEETMFHARGLPDDVMANLKDEDYHSHSWLTLAELKQAAADSGDPCVEATIAAMEAFEARGFKTRLVFAFDN